MLFVNKRLHKICIFIKKFIIGDYMKICFFDQKSSEYAIEHDLTNNKSWL